MKIGQQLKSLIRQSKEAGDQNVSPSLQGEWYIQYTTVTPM